jgi:signal transduction histidine kinase
MRLSLRYQLLLPMLVLLLGVAGLGAWVAVRSVQQAVRQQIEAQLSQVARTVSEASFPFTERVLSQLKDLTGADYLLTAPDGRRQATVPELAVDYQLADIPTADWHAMRLGTSVHLAGQNYLTAKILLRRSDAAAPDLLFIFYPEWRWREALWRALRPTILLGIVGSLLAVGLAVLVANWLARRIHLLDVQTRLIAQGQFRPLPLPVWNDELRDLAASVNAMAQQLARWQQAVQRTERLRLLDQVSGGLAHQLRNGVAGARLAVQVHARSCPSVEDRDILDVALRQLALMETQVQRLLQAGREEPPALLPCSLTQVLDEAISLMRPQCLHRHIELRQTLPKPVVDVLADAGQLGHLFVNVIGNAAEAIGANGWIEVRTQKATAADVPIGNESPPTPAGQFWHLIEVVDSGPGPPPELATRLFEEFVTSKPEGVGLGLAVARQVAAAHGGRIEWRRENGCTCFRIWLPMLESGAETRIQNSA